MSVMMSGPPNGTRVWLAAGRTDMRKGFTGLSALVQNVLASNPFCGQIFVFRGRRGDLLKLLWCGQVCRLAGASTHKTYHRCCSPLQNNRRKF
jgi:transposase